MCIRDRILAELDPHSTYIPAQNLEEVNSELEGSFSGIGIQFTIQDDTIHVKSVMQGGPSEKVRKDAPASAPLFHCNRPALPPLGRAQRRTLRLRGADAAGLPL